MMLRMRAYLRSIQYPLEEFNLVAESEAFQAANTAMAAKMPKLVETLDSLQGELSHELDTSLRAPECHKFFDNKYHTFLEDMMLDIFHDKPPQLSAFNLYLWTIKYEAKRNAGRLPERDDRGPLPAKWRTWVVVMLANVLVFQQHKITTDKEELQQQIQEPSPPIDLVLVANNMLWVETSLHQTWKNVYDRVQDFNRILTFMSLGHFNLMAETNQYAGGEVRQDGRRRSIREVLEEEIKQTYPRIEIPDLAIPEDLEASPVAYVDDVSGLGPSP
jgi:hypothetical protein